MGLLQSLQGFLGITDDRKRREAEASLARSNAQVAQTPAKYGVLADPGRRQSFAAGNTLQPYRSPYSQVYDQFNPLDNNRTMANPNPTNAFSSGRQLTNIANTLYQGATREAGYANNAFGRSLDYLTGNKLLNATKQLNDSNAQLTKTYSDLRKAPFVPRNLDQAMADNAMRQSQTANQINNELKEINPRRVAASGASMVFDLATLGTGGAAIKGGRAGLNQLVKRGALEGLGGGFFGGASDENVTLKSLLLNTAIGGTAGTVLPLVTYGAKAGGKAVVRGARGLDDAGFALAKDGKVPVESKGVDPLESLKQEARTVEKYPGLVDEIMNSPNARAAQSVAEQRGISLELSDSVLNVMKNDRKSALDIINSSATKPEFRKNYIQSNKQLFETVEEVGGGNGDVKNPYFVNYGDYGKKTGRNLTVEFPKSKDGGDIKILNAEDGQLMSIPYDSAVKIYGTTDQKILANKIVNGNQATQSPPPKTVAPVESKDVVPNQVNNLGDVLDIERFKKPQVVEKPKVQLAEHVNKLSDDQFVGQMVADLGVSEQTARKLIAQNNKPTLTNNLYGSKEYIRNADNPDAYANKIMNEAKARGEAAAQQNAPPKDNLKSEQTVLEVDELYDGGARRQDGSSLLGTKTGEVVAPKKAANINQFIEELPDARITPRARADEIIGEGAEWLRSGGRAIDDALKAKGDTWENFYRTIQQASDDVKAGNSPKLSKFHQSLYDTIKPTLDKLRKASGVETGETPYYLPRMVPGENQISMGNTLVDAIDAKTMGSQFKRTGKLAIDDTDLTPESLARYATQTLSEKYRHSMAADELMQAAERRGNPISPEQASKAVDMQNQFADDLAKAAKKGKDLTNDTVTELNKLGEAEGLPKVVNDHSPGMIIQSPENMLKRAQIWENGFKQYDYAHGYANEFIELFNKNNIPKEQFGDALRTSILKQMPSANKTYVDTVVDSVIRRMERNGIEPSGANALAINAFRSVAKDGMLNLAKTTSFSSNKMRKVVNEQINGRVLNDTHSQNAAQALDSFVTERINVSLRGLNVTSALFELGDIANIFSNYGVKTLRHTKAGLGKIDGDTLYFSHKYGEANASYLTPDIPQVSSLNKIWDDPNTSLVRKMYESYRTGENKLLIFRYVEQHKTELFFRTAEQFYKQKGLSGGELVNRVMSDYKKTMLPHKLATANRVIGKLPKVVTQYLNWGLQASKRMGRTLSGGNKAGKFGDMSKAERITRGLGTEILPKATAAALLGIPVMQILGIRDFTGATSGDFTGIDDEDKTYLDEAVKLLSLSPVLSVGGNFYFADRRNDIADRKAAAGDDYGGKRRPEDTPGQVAKDAGMMLVPFRTQFNKTKQVTDAMQKGYYENRDGRIQAQAPKGLEALQGGIFGKNYTGTLRDYQDNPNIVSVAQGKAKLPDLVTHNETVGNVLQAFGGRTPRDYNRPLSDSLKDGKGKVTAAGYSQMAKKAFEASELKYGKGSEQSRKVLSSWIKNGREYNTLYDNLQRRNPDAFKTWIATKDGDMLTPEKWRVFDGNRDVFNYEKQRKQLEKRDLGRAIDPIYEQSKERVNLMLQERSSYTGDDMKLRSLLYSKPWYEKVKKDEEAYFASFDGKRDMSGKTERVKEWNKLSEKAFSPDKGIKNKYPLVMQYEKGLEKFKNYNSQERKDFTSAWYDTYGDTYTKQKEDYDNERFNLVNKMRKLEGADQLSFSEFKANVEFPEDKDTSKYSRYSKYGKSGSKSGGSGGSVKYSSPYSSIIANMASLNKKVASSKVKEVNLKNKVKKPK